MLVVYGKLYNLFGTNRFANGIRMINFSSDLHKTKHSERTNENRQETARVLCLFLSVLLVLCNISDIEVLRYWKIGRLGGETHSHSRTINGFNNAGWDSCWLFLKTSRDEFSSASAGNSRTVSKSKLKTLLLPWTVAAVVALLLLRARWKSVETELKMRPLVRGFFYTPPPAVAVAVTVDVAVAVVAATAVVAAVINVVAAAVVLVAAAASVMLI